MQYVDKAYADKLLMVKVDEESVVYTMDKEQLMAFIPYGIHRFVVVPEHLPQEVVE